MSTKSAPIRARYPGTCAVTGRRYDAGALIERTPDGWARADAVAREAAGQAALATIHLQRGSGEVGGEPYEVGRTIRADWYEEGERKAGIVTILSCGQRYYRDDGMSFGVMDESGYVYYASARPATEEESRPLLAAEAAAKTRREARARLEAIVRRIHNEGTYPAQIERRPAGETFALHRDPSAPLYGGGTWLVIDAAGGHIWSLLGNGADGDDWSRNNLPSTIACFLPYTAELADEIRARAAAAAESPSDEEA